MKHRLLFPVLLLLTLWVVCALAETDGFTYDAWYGGVKTYSGAGGEVTIPTVVDGVTATQLASSLLEGNQNITSLTIPEGYTVSGRFVANDCTNLTRLTFPESLTVIGASSYQNLTGVTELTIPAGVALIGSNALMSGGFTEVTFEGVPPILQSGALSWLPEGTTFHVPDDYYDEYEALLTDIDSGYTVVSSGKNAIVVDRTCPESDFTLDESGLLTAYTGNSPYVVIPETVNGVRVTGIGEGVFSQATQTVWIVEVPEGLEELGKGAFKGSKVVSVKLPDSLKVISEEAFYQFEGKLTGWPASLEEIGDSAFAFSNLNDEELVLPEGLKRIGVSAFADARVYSAYYPSTLESIGAHAFDSTTYTGYLSYLNFASEALPEIGEDAFASETAVLQDVDMPWNSSRENWEKARDYFASIGAESCTVWRDNPRSAGVAFYPSQSEITVTDGIWVSYSGSDPDLTIWTAYDGANVTALGEGVFKGNQTIHSFYPHHCGWFTTIGAEAFADSSVAYVEMFDSITTIGSRAFANCTGLTELILPVDLTQVAADAFEGCGLTSVTIDCDPAVLPDSLFASCTELTQVTVAADLSVEEADALKKRLGLPEATACLRKDGTELAYLTMPYAETDAADFWYNETLGRLDRYNGYELNLYLPRAKDGIALTTLSGAVFERSMDSTYTDTCELPVKSVVVPETCTEILPGTFAYLPSVETIILYAPVDEVYAEMFTACTALKQVIFVNGAKQVAKDAFIGCYALESVYFGPDCVIDPDAFGYASPTVLTELPNVDALLAAVRSDPLPKPTEAPMPEAEPVTDPAAEAFLGAWTLTTVQMDGLDLSPAMLDISSYVLTLREDGLAILDINGEQDAIVWRMENGQACLLEDADAPVFLTLNESGALTLEEDGIVLILVRGA